MKLQQPHSTIVDLSGRQSAPWLTMVHAATHDQRYFSSQVQALQQDFRLLLIDLPGHGRSAVLPGPFGFEEYAVSVLAAMDANGVAESHYLGTHTGAAVGLMLASRHRRRFRSLILESAPIPGLELASVNAAINRARETARSSGIEAARAQWFQDERWFEIIRQHPERCRADAHWAMIAEFSGQPWLDVTPAQPVAPLLEQLSSIDCAVLIINGEHDVEDFLRSADEMERRLPRVRRVRIPGAGGFPMWEQPEQVNSHIRQHLQDAGMKIRD
jgi:pimeloyl-ACP methyl ester carboxylesterase